MQEINEQKEYKAIYTDNYKVVKIDYRNKPTADNYKTVFYVPTYKYPQGRMCVLWGRTSLEVGDEVSMQGRLDETTGVFIVWKINIKKRNTNAD